MYAEKTFFIGWVLFWVSLFLPMNTSLGGLTDAGKSYYGFINLFYSILSIFLIPEAIYQRGNQSLDFDLLLMAGVGICNLIIIFSPLILFVNLKKKFLLKYLMIGCALYVCIIGSVCSYHFHPIRYGHFVWCSSFLIVACAFIVRAKNKNALS